MGGDEFVVVLAGIRPEELESKIEMFDLLIRRASRDVCGEENVGISAGIAYFPDHGRVAEQLLSHADNEMYARKRARRGNSNKVLEMKRLGRVAVA
jgi:diguanylate cyclase (GGDEF)-like protein